MKRFFATLVAAVQVIAVVTDVSPKTFYRSFECHNEKCNRVMYSSRESSVLPNNLHSTMAACRLTCDRYGALWPVPTGTVVLGRTYAATHPSLFHFDTSSVPAGAKDFVNETAAIFSTNLKQFLKNEELGDTDHRRASVDVVVNLNSSDLTLDWDTDESYTLDLNLPVNGSGFGNGVVHISANSVYGVRHGLETLLQLTAPVKESRGGQGLVILTSAVISDAPAFPHRGLSLDTARHFVPLANILKTIDGLAACKMNVLHWHATDSQSFPLEMKRVPEMTKYGAYTEDEIYTTEDTRLIVAYGRARGVRVIPELDAPSHAGAGWEWGEGAGLGSLAVCVNSQPWRRSCIQPPCGQLNPVNENLYGVLRNIYKDLMDIWGREAVFHMGGDEVFLPCWNSTKEITDEMAKRGMGRTRDDFLQLWSEFQASVLRIVDEERGGPNVSAILWTSDLANPANIAKYLDKDRYVIHTWVESTSQVPSELLALGYRLIVSTKDKWYLDHGFWGKTVYHTWRDVYSNRIPTTPGVLGGEVAMWGEYIDGRSLDPRLWPRTAAVAERLWSDPNGMTTGQAEPRFSGQRDRLTMLGIRPEAVTPEWCAQHDGQCL